MFVCAPSDIHGAMDRLYNDVLAFEESLGVRFDCVLHVGDLGVAPPIALNKIDIAPWRMKPRLPENFSS